MLSAGDNVGRYRIERVLGQGGMAVVYLARHETLDTLHAIKVLTLTGRSLQGRLVAEGRIQAGLRHPNIVRVVDVIDVNGMPALVMDFIDGPDLGQWIQEHRPDPAQAAAVFRGIIAGVAAAHARGVIHRDLKPANVLMAREGDAFVPKVADFGLVKALAGDSQAWKTKTGMPMGTPAYMAPEQIRDAAHVDVRADVFSLGCILYELLAHRQAYFGDDMMEIFERVQDGRRAPLPSRVPTRLVDTVAACLRVDAADRPANCDAVRTLLEPQEVPPKAVPRAPMSPVRPSPVSRLALGVGMGMGMFGLAAVVVGVGIGVLWGSRRSNPEGPCLQAGGQLGWARAPALFTKSAGSTWQVASDTPVVDALPGEDEAAQVCVLLAGTQITLGADPVREAGIWVEVHGRDLGGPIAGSEDCPDARDGTVIGYANPRPFVPKVGVTWRVNSRKNVYADYPREHNDFKIDSNDIVCVLPSGTSVELVEEPIRVGGPLRGAWVPIVGGGLRPANEDPVQRP